MRPHLILLAGCVVTAAVAITLGRLWMATTGQHTVPFPVAVASAAVSVAASLAVENAVRAVRSRRARGGPARHRKEAA